MQESQKCTTGSLVGLSVKTEEGRGEQESAEYEISLSGI
jgi:hypothetical protein